MVQSQSIAASMRPGPKAGSNANRLASSEQSCERFNEARPEGRE